MSRNISADELSKVIIKLIDEKNPENVSQLTAIVKERTGFREEIIVNQILRLQSEGKITFRKPPQAEIGKLSIYLRSEEAYWYWIIVALAIVTTAIVFTVPDTAYPWVYARYVLGTVFVVWLPGYTLIKVLFPSVLPIKMSTKGLDSVERLALSIGMSLALVPIVGLLLNYTPWGIRLTPIVLSLLTLTLVFATAAITREYQNQLNKT